MTYGKRTDDWEWQLRRMRVEPGDVVVLRMRGDASADAVEAAAVRLAELLEETGARGIVLPGELRLEMLTDAEEERLREWLLEDEPSTEGGAT